MTWQALVKPLQNKFLLIVTKFLFHIQYEIQIVFKTYPLGNIPSGRSFQLPCPGTILLRYQLDRKYNPYRLKSGRFLHGVAHNRLDNLWCHSHWQLVAHAFDHHPFCRWNGVGSILSTFDRNQWISIPVDDKSRDPHRPKCLPPTAGSKNSSQLAGRTCWTQPTIKG
jgi:hypothetical protein